jgi:two-component system chemotaxis sensor kinase CheA
MSFDEGFLRELLSTFVAEAEEHLHATTHHLLDLERGMDGAPAFQRWTEVFREIHSLKGAARAMNLERVEDVAHRLETLFGRARDGQMAPTPAFFNLAYLALDVLADLVRAAGGLTSLAEFDMDDLLTRLDLANTLSEVATTSLASSREEQPRVSAPASPARTPPAQRAAPQPAAWPVDREAAAPSPALPAKTRGGAPMPVEESVRVATTKLEALMAQMGELQVARLGAEQRSLELRALLDDVEAWESEQRSGHTGAALAAGHAPVSDAAGGPLARLREVGSRLRGLQRRYEADQRRLTQVMAGLQDDVRRMRMLPISTVFGAYPRMVRDLAHDLGKDAHLLMQGGDTEVDRSVLEQIKDPLTHLLRNALDHGIELPEARVAAGKPATGTITLAASQRGDNILIEVSDDGQGITVADVRANAVRKGFVSAAEARAMSDHEALWLIFRSGVSTSSTVTDVSGRGVGMDVVRDKVERLHGLIDVNSIPGTGARFTLTLPLTVATTLCLLVQVAGQTFAVPITNVTRIVRLQPDAIGYAEGQTALRAEGRPILLLNLADILGLTNNRTLAPKQSRAAAQSSADLGTALILGSAEKRLAFRVDTVTNAQEVVVKPLPKPLLRVRYVVGASILGTGEMVLVLNAADLLRTSVSATVQVATPTSSSADELRTYTIMVVDDSITTRTLEKNILEAAGYVVRAFADGMEAWNALQSDAGAPDGAFDLVVSDVAMPRLNGFDLTVRVRADERLKNLPVVLVTSLDSQEDRERGVQSGADAYIVKGAFDQDKLLETIRRLI